LKEKATTEKAAGTTPTKSKAGAKKKTGAKKAKKEGPKRPTSAYILYSKDHRDKVKKANPEATFAELAKLVAEAWSNAPAADKKKYDALAAKDKARYEKEKAAVAVCRVCDWMLVVSAFAFLAPRSCTPHLAHLCTLVCMLSANFVLQAK